MANKRDLHQVREVVVWRSPYSQFVTNKTWKHESLQVMTIV
jgi:hypothetical protein